MEKRDSALHPYIALSRSGCRTTVRSAR